MDKSQLDKTKLYTIEGIFTNNKIIQPYDGDIPCMTYNSIRQLIEGHFGYFNIKWSEDIQEWILFQYLLL